MNSQPPLANRSGESAGSGTVVSHISPSAVASGGWRNANEMSLPHVTVSGGGSAGGGSGSAPSCRAHWYSAASLRYGDRWRLPMIAS